MNEFAYPTAQLGVEAMSVYKHVAGKDALLDGMVELLCTEVHDAVPDGTDWAGRLRSFAHAVRAVMHRHPQAAPLLLSRCVLPPPLLETYAALLDGLRDAGFDQATAAQAGRSLCSYAMGYGITELYCFAAWRAQPGHQPADTPRADTVDIALWLGRNLPPQHPTPPGAGRRGDAGLQPRPGLPGRPRHGHPRPPRAPAQPCQLIAPPHRR